MLTLSARVRILVSVQAVDFRRGIDGLLAIVRDQFSSRKYSIAWC
jgi:hypothetical protein